MKKTTDFAYHLTNYLRVYLPSQRNRSIHTIRSYRDTFKLLLLFCNEQLRIATGRIRIDTLSKQVICDFLDWLHKSRGNSLSSVNQRLAAIHAFFRYLQNEEPSALFQCQQILSVPMRKTKQQPVGYLSEQEMRLILAQPNPKTRQGRRDLVLLSVLYDTAARVQELCDLRVRDVFLTDNPCVMLTGKPDKSRYVPLLKNTAATLKTYMAENRMIGAESLDTPLFQNQRRMKMTRSGISYVVDKYAAAAQTQLPFMQKNITPHIFRHSKAMHLCQAGVDTIYIRDILGHVDLATTEIYARINMDQLRDALEKAYPDLPSNDLSDWNDNDSLMNFLTSI
jgi:site-specific recombinase XerD